MKSYFENLEHHILKAIIEAKESINIAVAWFTNPRLYNALISKLIQGVNIRVVIRNDSINNHIDSTIKWHSFLKNKGELFFMNNSLHTKYAIIDKTTVLMGSCNWTMKGCNSNIEQLSIINDKDTANSFSNHFDSLAKLAPATINDIAKARTIEQERDKVLASFKDSIVIVNFWSSYNYWKKQKIHEESFIASFEESYSYYYKNPYTTKKEFDNLITEIGVLMESFLINMTDYKNSYGEEAALTGETMASLWIKLEPLIENYRYQYALLKENKNPLLKQLSSI